MKKAVFALLVLGLLGAGYAYTEYNRGQKDMSTTKSDLASTSQEIFQAYSADETAANTKYLGKTVTIKGKVSSSNTEDGATTVVLFSGTEAGSVSCKLDPLAQHKKTTWAEGEEVTVKGICTGALTMLDETEVILERCVVD
jgi:tRNA_anti-like